MNKTQKDWTAYYENTKRDPPSELLIKALNFVVHKNEALDIGAGALKDTKLLLEQGFNITAIDQSPLMKIEADALHNHKLFAMTSSFEEFDFPKNKYEIVSAMFALPFLHAQNFDIVFEKIKQSLKKNGIFCGQFFGVSDDWSKNNSMTFHTAAQVKELCDELEIISFSEIEKDGFTADRMLKHWHFFNVIARK